jgi:hypothetical protein
MKNVLIAGAALAAAVGPELIPLYSEAMAPGTVCIANEARFDSRHYSEPLTTYITGWKDPADLEGLLNFVAPPVQVARRFEFKAHNNAQEFYSEADDIRAIGADFKRVEYTGTSTNSKTLNKGLTIRLDKDEIDGIPGLREQAARRLKQRILRNEARRIITALIAGATNAAKTWDTSAGKDPDQDVLTMLIAGVDDSGIRANRILYGDVAWNKRGISHRAQATAGGFASAQLTPEALAGLLGVDQIRVSRERYQSTATAKSKITTDVVVGFYADDTAGPDDPSNMKRFWSPVESGGMFRVLEQEVGAKFVDITVEHYSIGVLTTSLGMQKLTIS